MATCVSSWSLGFAAVATSCPRRAAGSITSASRCALGSRYTARLIPSLKSSSPPSSHCDKFATYWRRSAKATWKFFRKASWDGEHKEGDSSDVEVNEKTWCSTSANAPATEPSPQNLLVFAEASEGQKVGVGSLLPGVNPSTPAVRRMRKGKGSPWTLGSQTFFQGNGRGEFRTAASPSSSDHKGVRKGAATSRFTRAAVPGDAINELNDDYLPNFTDKSLHLKIRAICFYLWTYSVAVPLFFVMLALQPFVLMFDKYRRKAQHVVNRVWASVTILLFYKAEIIGLENLPSSNDGAVYVANHQSFLDIYTLFLLGRPFKFISKTSNFLIPIIGWSMYLTGHVPLKRLDKRSQLDCLKKCIELVKKGVPVLFFPEGTRTSDGKMAAFKRGAFNVAAKGNVPVVPIALIGTGKLMPNGLETTLRPGKVKVIIHPQIQGGSADELCTRSREVIAQTLMKYGLPVE